MKLRASIPCRLAATPVLLALVAAPFAAAQVSFEKQPDRIAVSIGGKPFGDFYLSADGNKPYLFPLRTASGTIVTRRFPMEKVEGETNDHPHHRGMFFSHGNINGFNFWATEPGGRGRRRGRMALRRVVETKGGRQSGTLVAIFEGLDPQGNPIMRETRTLTFHSHPTLRIVDFAITILPLVELKFADTKEGTFGIRLATPLSEAQTGRMVNAEGLETEKNVWGKRSAWVDYFGQLEGRRVGVAIMDHPSNPRHPTYWHTRAYGLHAANPFGVSDFTRDESQDGSMTLKPNQAVTFKYRVVVHPGDAREANIAALYTEYAQTR